MTLVQRNITAVLRRGTEQGQYAITNLVHPDHDVHKAFRRRGTRLAVPSVYIAAEPGSVGASLVDALKWAMPTGRAGTRPAPTS